MVDDKKETVELDKKIADVLNDSISIEIDIAAKKGAINLAMAEYHSAQQEKTRNKRQGFFSNFRLTSDINKNDRSERMIAYKRYLFSGLTAACVSLIAFGLFLQNYKTPDIGLIAEVEFMRLPTSQKPDELAPLIDNNVMQEPIAQAPVTATRSKVDTKPEIAPKRRASSERESFSAMQDMQAGRAEKIVVSGSRVVSSSANSASLSDVEAPANAYKETGRDRFENFTINLVKRVAEEPVSTFSVDVDTASYSFVRRQLNQGVLPQKDAVRIEEMINYFDYQYPQTSNKQEPFKTFIAVNHAPWAKGKKLMHIGIKGYDIPANKKPRSNLVFLLDVSGSMNSPDKLPLVKQSMELLLSILAPDDTVAIVVYAGAAGAVLEPTKVKEKAKILSALNQLSAGGSTAGAQGIRLAYELAEANFDKNAVNRIILATDGDFNVGISNPEELKGFVERKREKGIFLSVLGFGEGNYHDQMMQTLAQNGNGIASYIDTISEAQKILVNEATSSLFPIASDVKIQIEFNPKTISEYRLIGYETRHLNHEDFNNDAIDAGDIGSGHTVTAIYEITPVGSKAQAIDESRYANKDDSESVSESKHEYAFVKLRYKLPTENDSKLLERAVTTRDDWTAKGGEMTSQMLIDEVNFATAVAGFAQILKGGQYTGKYSYDDIIKLALQSRGADEYGYRTEFVQLVRKAKIAAAMIQNR